MREIVLDTETTGLDFKKGDRVIEVACVELHNHVVTGKNLQFYCSTTKKITEEAVKIHGLTNSFLNKHPPFKDQVAKFLNFIKNDPLIIHNADFDIGFLNNELLEVNVVQMKQLLNEMIARETQKIMIANTRDDYAFKIIDPECLYIFFVKFIFFFIYQFNIFFSRI